LGAPNNKKFNLFIVGNYRAYQHLQVFCRKITGFLLFKAKSGGRPALGALRVDISALMKMIAEGSNLEGTVFGGSIKEKV